MALRTYWSEIAPDILAEILPLARGSYQRDVLLGRENLSGSTLKGRALGWGARYHASRAALLARLRAAGFRTSERRAEHNARILIVTRPSLGVPGTMTRTTMTKADVEEYVRSCGETEGPDGDVTFLAELFVALYGRQPDQDDWDSDLWSMCCAAVD